jgi:hypothetical protein
MQLRPVTLALLAGVGGVVLAGCKHDAQVHGTLTQSGKGVPGATVSLTCPDGSKRDTTTNASGDFRFEELGPGVDDACTVEAEAAGAWVPPLAIASRCGQHDAAGLCTEAVFAFEMH